mgnify:CR=1 FL=1
MPLLRADLLRLDEIGPVGRFTRQIGLERLLDGLADAKAAGLKAPQIQGLLKDLRIRPTITAHPTEGKRVTVLEKFRRIYLVLRELELPRWTERERNGLMNELRDQIELVWMTGELHLEKPTVEREVAWGLHFFDESLFEMLSGIGDPEHPAARFPGSFGSSYLYFVVPKVILFRTEHSKRTLVPKVSYISAPGGSDDNVYRNGGPVALITNRCLFSFDQDRRRFRLESVHPGHTLAEVIVNTGFEFDRPPEVPVTPAPSAETLRLMRQVVAPELAEVYPQFAARVFGVTAAP